MKLRVLGCSGGIGGRHLRTTALLLDEDILIDCGTGVADLSIDELARIEHVFLTHEHLDHIVGLPLLIDTVCDLRATPLQVHCLPETAASLRRHVFNWTIWPDFTVIPSARPGLVFENIAIGRPVDFGARRIVPLPVAHTVPAVAFQLAGEKGSLVYSGDTGPCPAFWSAVNAVADLRVLLIESAFSDSERSRAESSQHLCPSLLAAELQRLERRPEIYITHLKPGQVELTMAQIERDCGTPVPRLLQHNQVFEL